MPSFKALEIMSRLLSLLRSSGLVETAPDRRAP
jgi:hypothetical protein